VISSKFHAFIANVSQNWCRCGLLVKEIGVWQEIDLLKISSSDSHVLIAVSKIVYRCELVSLRFFRLRIVLLNVDYIRKAVYYSVHLWYIRICGNRNKVNYRVHKLRGRSFETDHESKLWKTKKSCRLPFLISNILNYEVYVLDFIRIYDLRNPSFYVFETKTKIHRDIAKCITIIIFNYLSSIYY